MNSRLKNILGVAGVVLILVWAYAALAYVRSYEKSIYPPSFGVSGEGRIAAIPDIATFNFSVITQGGEDISSLQIENTERANAVIAFLKEEGVEDRDIKTISYDLIPRRTASSAVRPQPFGVATPSVPADEIVGFTVTQTVEVKVRDFEKLGTLLSGVVSAGANSVSSFIFTFDDPIELRNQARTLAIEEAQRKAEIIASTAGFKIGRLMSIDEYGYSPYSRMGMGGGPDMAVMDMMEGPMPNIEPGEEDILVNVNLRYEIR